MIYNQIYVYNENDFFEHEYISKYDIFIYRLKIENF